MRTVNDIDKPSGGRCRGGAIYEEGVNQIMGTAVGGGADLIGQWRR